MAESLPKLEVLTTRPNELDAGLIRAVLAEAGIESWLHTAPGALLGAFGTLTFVPTQVRVRELDLARARDVLDQNRKDSVDLDWDEVDVGEPTDDVAAAIARREAGAAREEPKSAAFLIVGWTAATLALTWWLGWPVLAVSGTLAVVWAGRRIVLANKRARREVWGPR